MSRNQWHIAVHEHHLMFKYPMQLNYFSRISSQCWCFSLHNDSNLSAHKCANDFYAGDMEACPTGPVVWIRWLLKACIIQYLTKNSPWLFWRIMSKNESNTHLWQIFQQFLKLSSLPWAQVMWHLCPPNYWPVILNQHNMATFSLLLATKYLK